jgi:hypothetical protein
MMAADSALPHLIVPSGVSFRWRFRVVARAVRAHSRRTSRCLRRSRPTCRRLASNAPGLRPSPRSPARWLLAQQRRRAAAARSDSEGQRRKARQKDAAPGRVESQSARGVARHGAASPPCRVGARPAPMQACPRASHDRTRQSLQERSHDRPPRRRFPRAPQRPEEPGQGPGPELRFQGAQAGRQGQQRQVGGAPSWGGRHRPAARLAPGRGHTAARFAGRS